MTTLEQFAHQSRLDTLRAQYARAVRAWYQNPTPSLGSALRRLENAIKYAERTERS